MHEVKIARWSRYLLFFILAVLPLERIPSLEATFPIHMTIRLSQLAGLALIAINLPLLWRERGRFRQKPWIALAAFWLVCIVSAGLAGNLHRSLTVTAFTLFVGLLGWVVALRFERDQVVNYLKVLVISALAVCAFGFYQFFGDLLGLPPAWTGLREAYTKAVFGFPRIQSTGLEPLYFGNYLLIPLGILLMAVALGYRRWLALLLWIPMATVVWLTVSRGAIVALAVITVISLIVALARTQLRAAGAMIGAAAVSVGLAYGLLYLGSHYVTQVKSTTTDNAVKNFSKQTVNISSGESSTGRAVTRELALKAFVTHPVLGIGPGNFGSYAAREKPDRFSGEDGIVNNETLEILAETGALGVLSLGTFLVMLLIQAVKSAGRRLTDHVMVFGLFLAVLAIAMQYQTFSTLYITHVWVAIGLLSGFVLTKAAAKKER